MPSDETILKGAHTIRLLAADAVEQAGSGHPGMPMGCADYALTLWHKYMRHRPSDPRWLGRDRFILSAGHGSMLVYSLLHLFNYGVSLEELKQFRQWGSLTPGHPEYGNTPGVEVTTGPLATGFATGVGMAIAGKNLAARMEAPELFDQKIFVMSSDGCMMEGVSHEAASLAGHNNLDNLICFYDDNQISIEGSTDLAFSRENVAQRFEGYGWNVLRIDAHNQDEIDETLSKATNNPGAPTLIVGKTTIGYGAPSKAGDKSAHGEPLGEDEIKNMKQELGFSPDDKFIVPEDVRQLCDERTKELENEAKQWDEKLENFKKNNPEKAKLFSSLVNKEVPDDLQSRLREPVEGKETASRKSGGAVMQEISKAMPAFIGGSADLAPSTKTLIENEDDFCASNWAGRNLHFGVREFCMGLAANGMALYGTALPYTATFFVFSDFMKPAIRLAAIQNLNVVFVYTHDSVFVGEDGPTHQPIEQLAMLRGIPGLTVLRPGSSREVADAWDAALRVDGPTSILLTRQNIKNIPDELAPNIDVAKGAYVLSDDDNFECIIIASGSELMEAYEAAQILRKEGKKVRVVSMPSWELFEQQDQSYQEKVLPPDCQNRISVEAATTFGWERYVGRSGLKIGVDHFGDSAPQGLLKEKYGLDGEGIAQRIKDWFK